MIAMTISVAASSMILLAVEASLSRTLEEVERQMARDIADLVFAEMELMAWNEPGASSDEWPLKAEGGEVSGASRANFDDLGDYNGVAPPRLCDRHGKIIGTGDYLGGDRPAAMKMQSGTAERINFFMEVRYVSESNFWDAVGSPTNVRHVTLVAMHRLPPYTEIDRFHRWFVKPQNE